MIVKIYLNGEFIEVPYAYIIWIIDMVVMFRKIIQSQTETYSEIRCLAFYERKIDVGIKRNCLAQDIDIAHSGIE